MSPISNETDLMPPRRTSHVRGSIDLMAAHPGRRSGCKTKYTPNESALEIKYFYDSKSGGFGVGGISNIDKSFYLTGL
jgi:hypothetical protein